MFRIMYSKPSATFTMGGTTEVAVSCFVNRPKRRCFNIVSLNQGDMRVVKIINIVKELK